MCAQFFSVLFGVPLFPKPFSGQKQIDIVEKAKKRRREKLGGQSGSHQGKGKKKKRRILVYTRNGIERKQIDYECKCECEAINENECRHSTTAGKKKG